MHRTLGGSAQETAWEGCATVHQSLIWAETVRAGLWQPQR
jgi:hypothetical protein